MAQNNRDKQIKYVRNLPYLEREELCIILDQNNYWEKLAVISFESEDINIEYDGFTIRRLSRERSPTDELLTLWSHGNNTILDLFKMLSKMHHYQAMAILKRYVDPKYHLLIDRGEGNLQRVFGESNREDSNADNLEIDPQNFNNIETTHVNISKVCVDRTENDLGDGKILNVSPDRNTDRAPRNSRNNLPSSSNVSSLQTVADISKSKKGSKTKGILVSI